MKILYIHQYFSTPDSTIPGRSYEFGRRLVEHGHEVHMLCSDAYLTKLPPGRQGSVHSMEVEGINVHAVRCAYRQTMSPLRRILAFLTFVYFSRAAISRMGDFEVVFATSTPLTVGIPGMFAARRRRCPLVFEVRDLWPELPIKLGYLKNPLARWAARFLERKIYSRSARIVALSPFMVDGVAKTGFPKERIHFIPNCSDLDINRPKSKDPEFRRRMGWADDAVVVLYPGTLGFANGLHAVIDAAPYLQESAPNVTIALVGEGNEKKSLTARVIGEKLTNVVISEPIPRMDLPRLLNSADIGLISLKDNPVLFGSSPNKFFDFLSVGKPIVMNCDLWLGEILKEFNCGIPVEPSNPKVLAEAITRLANDEELRRNMGANSRRAAEQRFDRDKLAKQLEGVLLSAVDEYSFKK